MMKQNGYLKLDIDHPVTIALKYPTPKPVKGAWGPQLLWFLADGKKLFTPDVVRRQIEELGIQPGEKFQVAKLRAGKSVQWKVERVPSQAALLLDRCVPLDGLEYELPEVPASSLDKALRGTIQAVIQAEEHGKKIGYHIQFTPSDIRELALSVLRQGRAA